MKPPMKLVRKANRLLAMGKYHLDQKDPKKALDCFQKVQKIIKKGLWDERAAESLLNNKGIAYFLRGDYGNSISHLERSLKMKRRIGNPRFIVGTLMNLAFSYRANCKYNDSLSALLEVRGLSKNLGDKDLAKKVEDEINITILAKEKRPMIQLADMRIMTHEGISMSVSDFEYLPNLFNELVVRIEGISVEIPHPLEAVVSANFLFENTEKAVTDPYETDAWKQNRPADLRPRIPGSTPNFAVFFGPTAYLASKDVRITDEEGHVVKFDSREQLWSIFVPDSYPPGGFSSPIPICERMKFFSGAARIFYWKLSLLAKYRLELRIRKNVKNAPFQFGLLFPFKTMKISAPDIFIELKDDFVVKQANLKCIPYRESKKTEIGIGESLDFSKYREIYAFKGDGVLRLKKSHPGFMIVTKDFEALCFEIFPLRSILSKFDLFPILKPDLDFREETGNERYTQLIREVKELSEKCQPHTTETMCSECATEIKRLCVVNLLGIVCDSDVLPHHGFEYSDLLIRVSNKKRLMVPVLAKGAAKLTWKKDGNLTKQLLEKLHDEKVEIVVVATSGRIGNRLKIELDSLADDYGRALIFLTYRDLAQFLAKLKQLHS